MSAQSLGPGGDPNKPPVVTLTAEQRDAFCEGVDMALYRLRDGDLLSAFYADPRGTITQLSACVLVFDALGWEKHGERETYELRLDGDVARLSHNVAEYAAAVLADFKDDRAEIETHLAMLDSARLVGEVAS